MHETNCQSRFDARYWMLGAGALGRPRGMVWGGGEEGSRWGTHVYLWQIHFDVWQNKYNYVKFKNKIKKKEKKVPWAVRRLNQSIPKEINPEYALEGLMLKLKLQYFGHLMRRANSLEKTLMLGKIEGRRRRGQ